MLLILTLPPLPFPASNNKKAPELEERHQIETGSQTTGLLVYLSIMTELKVTMVCFHHNKTLCAHRAFSSSEMQHRDVTPDDAMGGGDHLTSNIMGSSELGALGLGETEETVGLVLVLFLVFVA